MQYSSYEFGPFRLDPAERLLLRDGERVALTPKVFETLVVLVERRGHLVGKEELMKAVWPESFVEEANLTTNISTLRKTLGEGQNGRAFIETVAKRGYRFTAQVKSVPITAAELIVEKHTLTRIETEEHTVTNDPQAESTAGAPEALAVERVHADEQAVKTGEGAATMRAAWPRMVIVSLSLLLGVAGFLIYRSYSSNTGSQIESIAVLPFRNESGNSDVEYLSDGMTETLINSLSRLPQVAVKARSSVFRYQGKDVDPQQVASQLSVQAILTGRLLQRGDDLTLYLSLIDGHTGNQLWGEKYDRKMKDLAALQTDIARDVSQKLRLRLTTTEREALKMTNTENTDAYRAYLKGRYYLSRFPGPGYEKSRVYFQQAIDLDPTYALGYVGLAHYYGYSSALGVIPPNENWLRSEAALNHAMALDNSSSEAYGALVGIQLYYYRDWPAAEQSFRRALELNPNSAEARHHYARCLVLFGRDEEALAQMKRTLELDPLSLLYNLNSGRLFFFVRQYDHAIDQLHKTLELEPNFAPAHEWLGYAYEQKGMEKEAIAEWTTVLKLRQSGEQATSLEQTYTVSGFQFAIRSLAQQRLKEAEERSKRGEYVPAAEYVAAYARLGDKEQALAWLPKATEERNRFALEFKVNPLYDHLRDEPRFQDSLRRVGVALSLPKTPSPP